MEHQLGRILAKRGAVYIVHKLEFPKKPPVPKYCVLMEDYSEGMPNIFVALTTSNMDYKDKPTAFTVPDGEIAGMNGETSIDVSNLHELPSDIILLNKNSRYLDTLSAARIRQLDLAVTELTETSIETIYRIRGNP